MAEPMTLRDEDVGRIREYVRPWLRELVEERVSRQEPSGVGTQLLERMVRVEEELKARRTLMDERFGFMERRFEDMFSYMGRRFDAVDKRFDGVDTRYQAVDTPFKDTNTCFKTLTWVIGVGFFVLASLRTLFALLP